MTRSLLPLLLLMTFAAGCAGPAKLAERSQDKLAKGDMWRAWELATRALDKAPANPEARAAAGAAAATIAEDWQRRIQAQAAIDSLEAAEEVMKFVAFRERAIRYTTVTVGESWAGQELALRQSAARTHYRAGAEDLKSRRPKRAYGRFLAAERFAPGFRDAAKLAERAFARGLTRVAVVPLQSSSRPVTGRDVAHSWRGDLAGHLAPPRARFTRMLPLEDVERGVRVSDLGRLGRADAVALGREAGADRVVWGSIGEIDARSGVQFFSETVARRVTSRGPDGGTVVRWVETPILVVARTRNVDVDLEYEVIGARTGATLARRHDTRTMKARVIWTAFTPKGAPDSYSLVSEQARASDPQYCKRVEARWHAVVGDGITLAQVLDAKRASLKQPVDPTQAVARIMAGAAFVLLEDLPSTEKLAFGALAGAWKPIAEDLLRLDAVDDADLGTPSAIVPER